MALTDGKLWWISERLRVCDVCGDRAGYVEFQSGPRRGQPNYDRPRTFAGIDLGWRFVKMQGYAVMGGHRECVERVAPLIAAALADERVELPAPLRTEGRPVWQKVPVRQCTKCTWRGPETDMARHRTLFGNGTYPAECPQCGATNVFGRTVVDLTDEHVILPAEDGAA